MNTKNQQSTFFRVFSSSHVKELKFIIIVALSLIFMAIKYNKELEKDILPPILLVFTSAISWAYISASKRLGSVDLFASEISTICKACLIKDLAKRSVSTAQAMLPGIPASSDIINLDDEKFTSDGQYTPVFDKYISDLNPLSFEIINRVTLFYIHRMMMIDSMKRLYSANNVDGRKKHINNMIYMQFLMYENGRLACDKLIEFPSIRAECKISILCSELETFSFLKRHYPIEDFRGKRLDLRLHIYKETINNVLKEVESGYNKNPAQWKDATLIATELRNKAEEFFNN